MHPYEKKAICIRSRLGFIQLSSFLSRKCVFKKSEVKRKWIYLHFCIRLTKKLRTTFFFSFKIFYFLQKVFQRKKFEVVDLPTFTRPQRVIASLSLPRERESAAHPLLCSLSPASDYFYLSSPSSFFSPLLVLSPHYGCVVVKTIILRIDVLPPPHHFFDLGDPDLVFKCAVFGSQIQSALVTNSWILQQQWWWCLAAATAMRRRDVELQLLKWILHLSLVTSTNSSVVSINTVVNFCVVFMFCCFFLFCLDLLVLCFMQCLVMNICWRS